MMYPNVRCSSANVVDVSDGFGVLSLKLLKLWGKFGRSYLERRTFRDAEAALLSSRFKARRDGDLVHAARTQYILILIVLRLHQLQLLANGYSNFSMLLISRIHVFSVGFSSRGAHSL